MHPRHILSNGEERVCGCKIGASCSGNRQYRKWWEWTTQSKFLMVLIIGDDLLLVRYLTVHTWTTLVSKTIPSSWSLDQELTFPEYFLQRFVKLIIYLKYLFFWYIGGFDRFVRGHPAEPILHLSSRILNVSILVCLLCQMKKLFWWILLATWLSQQLRGNFWEQVSRSSESLWGPRPTE
jgi:hypothetical protein